VVSGLYSEEGMKNGDVAGTEILPWAYLEALGLVGLTMTSAPLDPGWVGIITDLDLGWDWLPGLAIPCSCFY
jgi:hypothetical protein